MGVESYKHQFAKATLAQWFRDIASNDDAPHMKNFQFRPNRGAPHFGVWTEYPVALDGENRIVGFDPVWDEDYRWGFNEAPEGTPNKPEYVTRPPTYDEVVGMQLTPILIFDVALQHKGLIIHALEVVHRNGISDTKLEYMKRAKKEGSSLLSVHTISADWILSRVDRPSELVCQRIL